MPLSILASPSLGKGCDTPPVKMKDIAAPVKSAVDKFQLLPEFLKVRGLVKQHIDSFNYFVNEDMKKIIHTKGNEIVVSDVDPSFYVKQEDFDSYMHFLGCRYLDIRVEKPMRQLDYMVQELTPQICRLTDTTYAAPIKVDIEYTKGSTKGNRDIERKKDVVIGYLPIMLRSCRCVLSGLDEAELARKGLFLMHGCDIIRLQLIYFFMSIINCLVSCSSFLVYILSSIWFIFSGECPLDPGGYFVVKGTEKVILIQEQLSKNRIMIDIDSKGRHSSTYERKTKTNIVMNKDKIYLRHNILTEDVPVMVVFKAMGMESDQEVVQMVGRDPRFSSMLLPSIQDCAFLGIHTEQQAIDYLEKKVKRFTMGNVQREKVLKYVSSLQALFTEERARDILLNVIFSNVPVYRYNFRSKCIYIAVMLRRMMEAVLNPEAIDDKDYVGNKRLELSGYMISILFEVPMFPVGYLPLKFFDSFKNMNFDLKRTIDHLLSKSNRSSALDISQKIRKDIITQALERALSTGVWDVKRFRMSQKGVSQVVSRLSYIATLGHMTRIASQFEKSRKWGMLCPCDTPEGESCGLVKNLALLTHITTDEEEGPLISLCYSLGVEDLALLSAEEIHSPGCFLVIFNGLILGRHRQPQHFAKAMRRLRRAGKIGEFVSVYVNHKQSCIYIASDGGRVCRPLIIADNGVSRIKEHHMAALQLGLLSFDDFVREGLIEYLDVNEENNALIALYEGSKPEKNVTHIEIEPFTILGVCAGLIPFPHHNQSPRNTYQCAMGKQAMGNIAYNQLYRMDTLLYLLVYPQRPLLTTKTIELVNYDKLGAGQNATVAVMSYSGYDIEDAIVMNKSSLDRGFGRCIVFKKSSAIVQKYGNQTSDRIARPPTGKSGKGGFDDSRFAVLDADGIAAPGEIIRPKDIYLNKQSPINTRDRFDHPMDLPDSAYKQSGLSYKGPLGETAVVDKVQLSTDNNNNLCIKFLFRHTRRPELGDKFSSRHGQKGVCGVILPQEDFPFSERGICPDLIMNPHGFPSRMTIGKMIELLGSKAGVSTGRFFYGSAFGEPSGHADKVLDKMHARATGPQVTLTRQPTEGRARDGGLRLGEMERDCLIAYGASMLIMERLMTSSDQFQVCTKCGLLGYYNAKLKMSFCSTCKSGDKVSTMRLPYACKLLIQELQSMNIVPRLQLAEY
ncbi:DNA-directed RNA polymerase III subunit 2 [Nymphaea thermarum]|nr:DNA-directed RNA polymerase III subunit 2 [Nymphaea thermarum]